MPSYLDVMVAAYQDELVKIASGAVPLQKRAADAKGEVAKLLGAMGVGAGVTLGGQHIYKDWKRGKMFRQQAQGGF